MILSLYDNYAVPKWTVYRSTVLLCLLRALHAALHLAADVHLEDLLPALHVRQANRHAAVEAPRPQQRVVQDVAAVRGRHHDDAAVACATPPRSPALFHGART